MFTPCIDLKSLQFFMLLDKLESVEGVLENLKYIYEQS